MQFVFKILNKLQITVIILKFSQALHIVHVWLHVDSVGFKKLYIENKTTVCLHDINSLYKGKGYEPHSVKRSFLFLFGHEFPPLLPQWATEHFQLPSEDKSHLPKSM